MTDKEFCEESPHRPENHIVKGAKFRYLGKVMIIKGLIHKRGDYGPILQKLILKREGHLGLFVEDIGDFLRRREIRWLDS